MNYKEYLKKYNEYIKHRNATIENVIKVYDKSRTDGINMNVDKMGISEESSSYDAIFERQEIQERELKKNNKDLSLRYFQSSYNAKIKEYFIHHGYEPDVILKEQVEKLSEEKFKSMSEEEKKNYFLDIEREEVIFSASKLNLSNRHKNNEKVKNAFGLKDAAIAEYMIKVIEYNSKVDSKKQIAFGFNFDKRHGKIAFATSIPGYTRVSVHFGNIANLADIVKEVNEHVYSNSKAQNEARKIPCLDPQLHKDFRKARDKNIKLDRMYAIEAESYSEKVANSHRYPLKFFYSVPIGVVTRLANEEEKKDTMAFDKTLKVGFGGRNDKLRDFVNFVKPELNQREIIYLAEKMELSIQDIKILENKIYERRNTYTKINKSEKINLDDLKELDKIDLVRKKYIDSELEKASSDSEKSKRIAQLFEYYKIDDKTSNPLYDFIEFTKLLGENKKFAKGILSKILEEQEHIGDIEEDDFQVIFEMVDFKDKKSLLSKLETGELLELPNMENMSDSVIKLYKNMIKKKVDESIKNNEKVENENLNKEKILKTMDIFDDDKYKEKILKILPFETLREMLEESSNNNSILVGKELSERIINVAQHKSDEFEFYEEFFNEDDEFMTEKFIDLASKITSKGRAALISQAMIIIPEVSGLSEDEIFDEIVEKLDGEKSMLPEVEDEFSDILFQIHEIASEVSQEQKEEAEAEWEKLVLQDKRTAEKNESKITDTYWTQRENKILSQVDLDER